MPRLDLDAFLAEQNADPLTIHWVGKTITAPIEIPWETLSMAEKLHGMELDDDRFEELVRTITDLCLGKEDSAWLWGSNPEGRKLGGTTGMKVVNALMDRMMKSLPEGVDPKALMEQAAKERAEKRISESPSKTPERTSPSLRPISGGSINLGRTSSQESA